MINTSNPKAKSIPQVNFQPDSVALNESGSGFLQGTSTGPLQNNGNSMGQGLIRLKQRVLENSPDQNQRGFQLGGVPEQTAKEWGSLINVCVDKVLPEFMEYMKLCSDTYMVQKISSQRRQHVIMSQIRGTPQATESASVGLNLVKLLNKHLMVHNEEIAKLVNNLLSTDKVALAALLSQAHRTAPFKDNPNFQGYVNQLGGDEQTIQESLLRVIQVPADFIRAFSISNSPGARSKFNLLMLGLIILVDIAGTVKGDIFRRNTNMSLTAHALFSDYYEMMHASLLPHNVVLNNALETQPEQQVVRQGEEELPKTTVLFKEMFVKPEQTKLDSLSWGVFSSVILNGELFDEYQGQAGRKDGQESWKNPVNTPFQEWLRIMAISHLNDRTMYPQATPMTTQYGRPIGSVPTQWAQRKHIYNTAQVLYVEPGDERARDRQPREIRGAPMVSNFHYIVRRTKLLERELGQSTKNISYLFLEFQPSNTQAVTNQQAMHPIPMHSYKNVLSRWVVHCTSSVVSILVDAFFHQSPPGIKMNTRILTKQRVVNEIAQLICKQL